MRIIEENEEYKIRCKHCCVKIGFNIDDVYSTYSRGLDMSSNGWIDGDRLWLYIKCPKCGKYISVDKLMSDDDYQYLRQKYDNDNWYDDDPF